MNPRLCALAGLTGLVLVVGCSKQTDVAGNVVPDIVG